MGTHVWKIVITEGHIRGEDREWGEGDNLYLAASFVFSICIYMTCRGAIKITSVEFQHFSLGGAHVTPGRHVRVPLIILTIKNHKI